MKSLKWCNDLFRSHSVGEILGSIEWAHNGSLLWCLWFLLKSSIGCCGLDLGTVRNQALFALDTLLQLLKEQRLLAIGTSTFAFASHFPVGLELKSDFGPDGSQIGDKLKKSNNRFFCEWLSILYFVTWSIICLVWWGVGAILSFSSPRGTVG